MIEKNWLDLKKPDEMEIKVSEYNQSQAVVAVGPFERGFGVTIGNALRRVLLSSLQGAAVTSVQIQGVVHEFSSIPGVREDVITSSRTPGIDENSCTTPWICTDVTAAPCSDDNNTRRNALPMVTPKPRSNGPTATTA